MATTLKYDQCPCCGSAAVSPALTTTDYTVSRQSFEVWHCTTCTFRFTQDAPDSKHIAPYYQSAAYVSHSDTKEGIINKIYHLVRRVTLRIKRRLISRVTGTSRGVLLDVGAGTGAFAHAMRQGGWNVTGLEPDDSARAVAQATYGIALEPMQQLASLSSNSYDAITLWHVLEHVADMHGYLDTFHRLLKPAGRLIVAVPNYCSYDAAKYEATWAGYDVPRHLYHFSPRSMKVLVSQHSFEVEELRPMWFDSFYVSMLSEQNRKDGNLLRAFYNGLVSNMKTIADTGKCSSVVYVMRKV